MAEQTLTPAQIAIARARAQRLPVAAPESSSSAPCAPGARAPQPEAGTIAEVLRCTEHLLALQGQDFAAVQWALALRTGADARTIRAAFDDGLIVRSWPMRSTVHLVAATDLGWLQRATNHRVLKDWPKRRDFLSLDMATVDQVREVTRQALAGGQRLHRDDLAQLWRDAGIEMRQGWSYHLIWALNQLGDVVFGPFDENGRDLDLVLADEWITSPRRLDGDEALAELGRRYIVGHGPATANDLSWWTKLTVRESTRALDLAADASADVAQGAIARCLGPAGERLWALVDQLENALSEDRQNDATGQTLLLPAFDELLLGYRDKSAQLDPHFNTEVMTRNGIAKPTVLARGRVRGTWNVKTYSAELFEGELLEADESVEMQRQFDRFERFWGTWTRTKNH